MRAGRLTPVALSLALIPLFGVLTQEAVTVLLPSVLLSLGAAAGILGLVEALGAALGGLARRRGEKPASDPDKRAGTLLALSQGALALAPLILAAAWNWPVAALGRVLGWAAQDLGEPLQDGLEGLIVPAKTRKNLQTLAWTLAAIAAVAVPVALWALLGWGAAPRLLMGLAALPALGALGAALRLRKAGAGRRSGSAAAPAAPGRKARRTWGGLAQDTRRLLAAMGCFSLGNFSSAFFILYALLVLSSYTGPGPAAACAAGLYALRNAFQIAILRGAESLAARLPGRALLCLGWVCSALAVALLFHGVRSRAGLALAFSLAGLGSGLAEDSGEPLLLQTSPEAGREAAQGAGALFADLGTCLGSLACGYLWYRFGARTAFAAALCAMLASILWLIVDSHPARELLKEV